MMQYTNDQINPPPQAGYQYAPPEEQPYDESYEQASQEPDQDRIEEVAEAIIDEKWNELLKDINRIVEWKERTESRLTRIEQDLKNLQVSFESLHRGILGKISEYDKNLVNVGTEIKAMEKVFQNILPTLTDSVNKLTRATKK